MNNIYIYLFTWIVGFLCLINPTSVLASVQCLCSPPLENVTHEMIKGDTAGIYNSTCTLENDGQSCNKKTTDKVFCTFFEDPDALVKCQKDKAAWDQSKNAIAGNNAEAADFKNTFGANTGLSKIIPNCVLGDPSKNTAEDLKCRDVGIFVMFLINVARYLFSIVGALALVMFIYGGFTLILSQGSSEKVKKGTEIITASIIGLVIMFGAYMLVQYLGEAVRVKTEFKI